MAFDSYTDFTQAQWNLLASLIDAWYQRQFPANQGKLLIQADVNSILSSLVGEFKSVTAPQSATIASNTITIESVAKINLVTLDTNFLNIDELETIAWIGSRGMVVGDIYIFFMAAAGRRMRITDAGNFRPQNGSFLFQDLDSMVAFVVGRGNNLVELGRYPSDDTADTSPTTSLEYVTANTILASARVIEIVALTGETLAEGQIKIDTASGTSGEVTAFIDEGSGAIILGSFGYTIATTTTAVANGLAASINLGTYSASVTGADEVVITARPNTGSTANSFSLYSSFDGGVTTTDTAMGVVTLGVDGTEMDEDIDTITGGQDGPYYLKNAMATNILTLIVGGNILGAGAGYPIAAGNYTQVLKVGSNFSIIT